MDESHVDFIAVRAESKPQSTQEHVRPRRRIPVSTYRVQLHAGCTLRQAIELVPYWDQLGITDIYCSPLLRAAPGSAHGYDITDHSRLNEELGTFEDLQAFGDALTARRMGLLLDIVPNHMGIDPIHNSWWRDVLENGQSSAFARYFDIDWDPVKPELRGKILCPVLRGSYGLELERGELQLVLENGAVVLRYFDRHWPIDPGQLPRLLRHDLAALREDHSADDPHLREYLSVVTQLEHLPSTTETAVERVAQRRREKNVARDRLVRLLDQAPRIRRHLDAVLATFNGHPGNPASFDRLHELLEAQPYRLAHWRTALHEINYRRFFDVNDLAGLRMEDPVVFEAAHALVLPMLRSGLVTGLRLDHLDGLFDPAAYLQRLQGAVWAQWMATPHCLSANKDRDPTLNTPQAPNRACFVLAEKILSSNESLPPSWPLDGTSGYDYLNDLNRLFVDSHHMKRMKQIYARFTGQRTPYAEIIYQSKKLITRTAMASELNVLAHALNRISEEDRCLRDFTLISLRQALLEVVACFPIYRTYATAAGASETDRQMIDLALSRARLRNPAMEPSVFCFVREVLLPGLDASLTPERRQRRLDFAMKFQQYTGPVHAKGVEDTAFYRYNLLLSLNDVGGDPQRFGAPMAQFHELNRQRRERWPYQMIATATHDTKRGEDARARLNVLSEIPEEWSRNLSNWARINARHRTLVDGAPAPDRNDEYFFYQTLLAVWPATPNGDCPAAAPADLVTRLLAATHKAIKEAKVHTSWINPNEAYDRAATHFVQQSLSGPMARRFLAAFLPWQRRVALFGAVNSLAQVLLKSVAPGVPDFYQGVESWDLNLVDPDNRRPVNYEARERMLRDLEPLLSGAAPNRAAVIAELLSNWHDGRVKMLLTACALRLRRQLLRVFQEGQYVALEVTGTASDRLVALARRFKNDWVIAVAPRLSVALVGPATTWPLGEAIWRDTQVQLPKELHNVVLRNGITGQAIERLTTTTGVFAGELLRSFPVALLTVERF